MSTATLTARVVSPPTGHPARRGNGVYWDAAGAALPGPRPGVVVADVAAGRAEFVTDDPRTGFFDRPYLVVPVGESRPVPHWPGWAVHVTAVYLPDEFLRQSCDVYLSYDGEARSRPERPHTPTPF